MGRYFLALLALCTLSIIAIIALQPDPLVRFEAELSRMAPEEALEALETPGKYDIEQHNIALVHIELLVASGDLDAAEQLLKALEEILPQNAAVRRQRAQIAKLRNDTDAVIQLAQAQYSADPTPEGRTVLGLAHRMRRDQTAEIEVLRSVPPEQLTAWEVGRLSRLLQANGAASEAEALFARLASGQGELADEAKVRLVVMQIDEGRSHDALGETIEWYAASDYDPAVFETVLPVFLARGAVDEAIWFADKIIELSPASGHRLLSIFSASGHRAIARRFQDVILARRSEINEEEWAALIKFAALTGDVRGLQTIIGGANPDTVSVEVLSEALLQMLRYQGPRALMPYRQIASVELANRAPLVAAAFAIQQAQPEQAVRLLVSAAETDLNEWDQSIWLSMALRLKDAGYHRLLLTSPSVAQPLKDALAASL